MKVSWLIPSLCAQSLMVVEINAKLLRLLILMHQGLWSTMESIFLPSDSVGVSSNKSPWVTGKH